MYENRANYRTFLQEHTNNVKYRIKYETVIETNLELCVEMS